MTDTHRPGISPSTLLYSAFVPAPGSQQNTTNGSAANRVFMGTPTSTASNTFASPTAGAASGSGNPFLPNGSTTSNPSQSSSVEGVFIPETAELKRQMGTPPPAINGWSGPNATTKSGATTPVAALRVGGAPTMMLATPPSRRATKDVPPDQAILKLPAPLRLAFVPSAMCRCYVLRERESVLGTNAYRLFHETSNEFLAAARKRNKKQTSNYLIGLNASQLERDSEECVAKLRASVSGLEFVATNSNRDDRRELGVVAYDLSTGNNGGARSLRVLLPKLLSNGQMEEWRQSSESQWSAILNSYNKVPLPNLPNDLTILYSREPTYNESAKTHQLNFGGRVACASVKNFQLYDARDPEKVTIVQFGKVSEDRFILDFKHPVNVMQAFCMALTTFD